MRSGQKNTAVIDAGTAVRGSLEGSEDLHVEGRFEGQLRLTEALFVGPSAIVEASVHARRVEISGTLVGDVTATETLVLAASARVVGKVQAPRLVMAEGASLRGGVQSGDKAASTSAQTASRAATSTPRGRVTRSGATSGGGVRGSSMRDEERTLVVTHSELRAGSRGVATRTPAESAKKAPKKSTKKVAKKAPKRAAKKKVAKKAAKKAASKTRARVPARGKRKTSRR